MLEPKEISSSRLKYAAYLVIALTFVGFLSSESTMADRSGAAWFGLVFFSICSLASFWMLIRPQRLRLDPDGFTLSGGFVRSPKKVLWADVRGFFVYRLPKGGAMVGYNLQEPIASGFNRFNRSLFGAEAALPKGWSLSAEKLADELNDYREKALSRQA